VYWRTVGVIDHILETILFVPERFAWYLRNRTRLRE
jgi:hypothetical protein